MDYQLDQEDRSFYFSQRWHLRRRAWQGGVRGGGARIRALLPRTTLQIHVSSSSEFGEARPSLREILLVSPRDAARAADITHAPSKSIRVRRLRELMRKPAVEMTGIGGWPRVMNSEGKLDPWLSPWFSYELTRTDWPWIFEKEINHH